MVTEPTPDGQDAAEHANERRRGRERVRALRDRVPAFLRANLQQLLPGRDGRRRAVLASAVVLCLAAVGAGLAVRSHGPAQTAAAGGSAGLAPVTRGPLSSVEQVTGTVEYATAYDVVNEAQGVYTALPAAPYGQVVHQGEALYAVGGVPVVLLYGSVPAYRDLYPGEAGADVAELNADLVALGYATTAQIPRGSDVFTTETASAIERLQGHLGLTPSAELPLGAAVFLPEAVVVSGVTPVVGAAATAGVTVMQATSTTLQVVTQVDPAQQSAIHPGQPATITLADGDGVPGRVSKVAAAATPPSSGSSGGSQASSAAASGAPANPSTVEVDIAPDQPATLGTLDNASVEVSIATASVQNALSVPVAALLAQPGGGYAVEVARPGGRNRIVPVQLGLFDDAAGRVQVTGADLRAGQKVLVAGT